MPRTDFDQLIAEMGQAGRESFRQLASSSVDVVTRAAPGGSGVLPTKRVTSPLRTFRPSPVSMEVADSFGAASSAFWANTTSYHWTNWDHAFASITRPTVPTGATGFGACWPTCPMTA